MKVDFDRFVKDNMVEFKFENDINSFENKEDIVLEVKRHFLEFEDSEENNKSLLESDLFEEKLNLILFNCSYLVFLYKEWKRLSNEGHKVFLPKPSFIEPSILDIKKVSEELHLDGFGVDCLLVPKAMESSSGFRECFSEEILRVCSIKRGDGFLSKLCELFR